VSVSGVARETREDIAVSDDDKVVDWEVVVDPGIDVVDPEDVVDSGVVDLVDVAIGVGAGDFSVDVIGDAIVVVEETLGASDVDERIDDEVEVVLIGAGEAVDDVVSC